MFVYRVWPIVTLVGMVVMWLLGDEGRLIITKFLIRLLMWPWRFLVGTGRQMSWRPLRDRHTQPGPATTPRLLRCLKSNVVYDTYRAK